MKILYDHQAFSGTKYGGIARYFYDLMSQLNQQEQHAKLALLFSNNVYLKESKSFNPIAFKEFLGHMPTNMLFSQINRLNSILELRKQQFDIFHPTFYHSYFLNHIGNKPFVLSYFDLNKEIFNQPNLDNATLSQKQNLINKAQKIIAISDNTKNDILKYFEVNPNKIEVVHLSSTMNEKLALQNSNIQTPENYFLYVGNRTEYKNFGVMLKGFAILHQKNKNINLVCAGGGAFSDEENSLIATLGITKNIVQVYFKNDIDLFHLYKKAISFVYPSLYEGFGIPILEAFAAECACILSNASCFPEVAADAALYFDPTNAEDLAQKMETVLKNKSLQKELILLGNKRKLDFSKSITAQKTLKIYQSIV
ncbi:MAG: glycosyltransferase family 4 protein [Pseudarcicella sp.]|nr:glycosyltransferase family 4 protein [Pseudarcicella sp.]MBP6409841.1 glycosyltransferase family 4 protein [Pseudarcicella sp.]